MQQQIAVVTLAIADRARSRRFYTKGFGWTPVFENEEIVFFQMNGFVLGLFERSAMAEDMKHAELSGSGGFALAHNVASPEAVDAAMERLVGAGGHVMRAPDEPPHGGRRGYLTDPDGHAWEIAWNPAWPIDERGHVTFRA